ncbi:hypothetical protein BCR33DRAFT_794546 [Rhizoclosmatium globosum]|uniref:Uncharacterized protein n=1 Tax=Rhizoclosmatium globosum TaxID=329046 RepID=A0A1Y2AV51_9FUNG|nr:hypothetical protein BCR33DRAFT_794546 [Rhizoclosmatium globosum]|eukprot:ORY26422.1 hypothetical protein BCR33DRAFT_794546 [Rhizoclosmatium globosum]
MTSLEPYSKATQTAIVAIYIVFSTIALTLGCFSLLGLYIVRALNSSISLEIPWGTLFTLEQFFLATAETSYIYYSFRRSQKLVKSVFGPRLVKIITWSAALSPMCFYLPLISSILQAADATAPLSLINWIEFIAEIIAGLTASIIDFLLVCAFSVYLRRTRLEGEAVNKEFTIIASAGIFGSIICFVSIGLYIVATLNSDVAIHASMTASSHVILKLLVTSQFLMKVLLYRVKAGEYISTLKNFSKKSESPSDVKSIPSSNPSNQQPEFAQKSRDMGVRDI